MKEFLVDVNLNIKDWVVASDENNAKNIMIDRIERVMPDSDVANLQIIDERFNEEYLDMKVYDEE